uniref:PBZ-type domain-containing protein n=1 Tax=Anopheles epiroticus TaxID=199890 RepID=A0A182P8G8_9DIPT
PTKECQYAGECYRVNPVHFREYSHPHIEKLLTKAASISMVEIPDDVKVHRSVFTEQLKIVSDLFPHLACDPLNPEKKAKIEPTTSKLPSATPSLPASSAPKTVPKPSSLEMSSAPKPEPKPSSGLAASNKNPIESLFAERRAKMQSTARSVQVTEPAVPAQNDAPTGTTTNIGISLQRALPRDINSYFPVVAPRGQMAQKLAAAAPYNMFLTTITASKPTHTEPLSVTFQELLDTSLGELECSVQMNFMVDIGWLLAHYYFAGYENVPLLILYGDETPELRMVSQKKPNVTAVKVEIKTPFGVHHTKMGLYGYSDGSMRVVVSTANLYEDDWHNRTQGLWISPRLPAVPEGSDTKYGESRTDFRSSLLTYLDAYKLPQLQPWMARIRKTDFSDVKVFLVASVPGGHTNTPKGPLWGHPRLGYLLAQHAAPIDDACPLVAQSSSIGSLGPSPESWVLGEIMASFRKDSAPIGIRRIPGFRMIYPSFSNVRQSHDGLMGGGCLPYVRSTHVKQEWLKDYLQQWCSRARHRNKAMPHIKTYCRWSHRGLYWFLLTSANLSKAAWGVYNKTGRFEKPLRINSYEAGVLFLPKLLVDENFFPMEANKKHPPFPMPYDIPIIPEATEDGSEKSDDDYGRPRFVEGLRGRMADKLAVAAPYYFFLSTITDSQPTHTEPLSVTFQELLDTSLGELVCSVQINYMVDIYWLLEHYCFAGYENVPLLVLHGDETPELQSISQKKPNVTAVKVEIKTPVGTHHTKMGLHGYSDGSMRVIVSTANLYENDWHNRTQGLWISPRLPAVPEGSDETYGESRTEFRSSLLTYLEVYKLPQLQPWMERIRKTDFSDVRVFLVQSVPCNESYIPDGPLWAHPRLGHLLSQHAAPLDSSFPLVAQSSSIGCYGRSPHARIQREITPSFGKDTCRDTIRGVPNFRVIYPTYANVSNSHDGLDGGRALLYNEELHWEQRWLLRYLYQWTNHARYRNKAMPSIKTYCRWSSQGLQWFLLTSSNLSKSAWGVTRYDKLLYVNNFETGVLFLPRILDVFYIHQSQLDEDFLPLAPNGKHPQFPMPYDVPIVPYAPRDIPFFLECLISEESDEGNRDEASH